MERKADKRRTFTGRQASQGEIILRSPARRAIFIAGLVGFVVLAALAAWWGLG